MDWTRAVDGYCERLGAAYWAEPINAVSNAAFLIAAVVAWRLAGRDAGARILAINLGLIGVGSYLFHTHARVWALFADVIPIQAFILIYLYLATVRFFALPPWAGAAAAALFVPCSMLAAAAVEAAAGRLNGSTSYAPVPILIYGYAFALRDRAPATARALAVGASILVLSLAFRTVDAAVCPAFPTGTHFMWHLLNALMLGWMVLALVRHGEGPGLAARVGGG